MILAQNALVGCTIRWNQLSNVGWDAGAPLNHFWPKKVEEMPFVVNDATFRTSRQLPTGEILLNRSNPWCCFLSSSWNSSKDLWSTSSGCPVDLGHRRSAIPASMAHSDLASNRNQNTVHLTSTGPLVVLPVSAASSSHTVKTADHTNDLWLSPVSVPLLQHFSGYSLGKKNSLTLACPSYPTRIRCSDIAVMCNELMMFIPS